MYRRRGYRLFRPRYDWTMIRDQVRETAYGVSSIENFLAFSCDTKLCVWASCLVYWSVGSSHFHSCCPYSFAVSRNWSEKSSDSHRERKGTIHRLWNRVEGKITHMFCCKRSSFQGQLSFLPRRTQISSVFSSPQRLRITNLGQKLPDLVDTIKLLLSSGTLVMLMMFVTTHTIEKWSFIFWKTILPPDS